MSGHTKGPWSVPHFADEKSTCACSYVFSDSQRGFGAIATVQFGGEDENYETAKANAKLIAAAPDLLEALEVAAETFRRYECWHRAKGTKDSLSKAISNQALAIRLESAIAKARGEA